MLPPACLDLRLVDAAGDDHEARAAINKSEMRFYNGFTSADIRNAQRQNMQESDIREGNAIFFNTTS